MSAALDPCRPFAEHDAAVRPSSPPCHPSAAAPARSVTELELAIDRALAWSTRHLTAVIRLAALAPYLDAGGSGNVVAGRLILAADELAGGADELAAIVADLRATASSESAR